MIGIINYGSGNFTSVYNAVTSFTHNVKEVKNVDDLTKCSHIILPGVGAFNAAIQKLETMNITESLCNEVLVNQKHFLGICVGMQVLANLGNEFGVTKGLGWVDGEIIKFNFHGNEELTLPHIGWNDVFEYENNKLFLGINKQDPTFYFVHSYHLQINSRSNGEEVVYCNYGYNFPASISKGNIHGVQFHPEKSQKNGIKLLMNFCNL